jgi:hypothetical protein
VLITNATSSLAFVAIGAAVSAGGGLPVLPGAQILIGAGPYASQIAVILATGSGAVYATTCDGTER